MPWKLLAFILAMTVVLVFIGFNLENRCDVSVAFYTFSDVPVVITILASFLLGLLMAFPLSFGRRREKRSNRIKPNTTIDRGSLPDTEGLVKGSGLSLPKKGKRTDAASEDLSERA